MKTVTKTKNRDAHADRSAKAEAESSRQTRGPRFGRGILFIILSGWLLSGVASFAQQTNAPSRLSFDSFRTISDRNIFNPSRFARGTSRSTVRTSSAPASRVESFSLVGIMAYEQGVFAFFDGTKSEYKQAVQAEGMIGNYQVAQVTATDVKLALGTNAFALKVGMQMRREDEGEWFLSEGGDAPRRRVVSTRTRTRGGSRSEGAPEDGMEEMTNGNEPEIIIIEGDLPVETNGGENPPAEAAPDNGGVSDPVLLRLMQRRQEMTQ
jgi:hypothetical protein